MSLFVEAASRSCNGFVEETQCVYRPVRDPVAGGMSGHRGLRHGSYSAADVIFTRSGIGRPEGSVLDVTLLPRVTGPTGRHSSERCVSRSRRRAERHHRVSPLEPAVRRFDRCHH